MARMDTNPNVRCVSCSCDSVWWVTASVLPDGPGELRTPVNRTRHEVIWNVLKQTGSDKISWASAVKCSSHLVSADLQVAAPCVGFTRQQVIQHPEHLLHHRVLSQVVFALQGQTEVSQPSEGGIQGGHDRTSEQGQGKVKARSVTPDIGWLVGYWSFTPWHHLRSYQDGYRLVTVYIHDDIIVLLHWETKPPAP